MPTESKSTTAAVELDEIVEQYAVAEELPAPEWLIRLSLEKPNRNLRSLAPRTRAAKRCFDIVVAGGLLVLLSPVLMLLAIAVRLSSRGPIIFKQVRTGLNLRESVTDRRSDCADGPPPGIPERRQEEDRRQDAAYGRPFVLYKFRTMRVDAESAGPQFASENDPRVTPLGRLMRQTRLDELPQLWNVLRGQMSLVGPRPERPEFIRELSEEIPGYLHRLGLKPGLTGLAQIINGYDNNLEGFRRKVAWDLLYLQNCCLKNDLKILLRTVVVVLTGRGAL